MNDEARGTGRTTGLMLRALGDALLDPGGEVEFCNHEPMGCADAQYAAGNIKHMAHRLGLSVAVQRVGSRVFVVSTKSKA